MAFRVTLSDEAIIHLTELKQSKTFRIQYKAVMKALRLLAENPKHPGLQTHKYHALFGPEGVEVFEAYAQQNTPGAWRIFWCYYPSAGNIWILGITKHP